MLKYILFFLTFIFSSAFSQSNFEWKTYFGGNYERGSEPIDCVLDDGGNMYITGYEIGPSVTETSLLNIYTIKVNPGGTILWKKSYGVPGYHEDTPYSICLDNAGNVFVLGTTPDSAAQTRFGVIIKYSNDGTFLWDKKFYTGSGGGNLTKILYHNSKLFTATNYTVYDSVSSYSRGSLSIFSSITGDSLGSLHSLPDSRYVRDFLIDKNGNLYVNWVQDWWPPNPANVISKYDRNFNLKWSYNLDPSTFCLSLSVDKNFNVYLSGNRYILLGGYMLNTMKLDSNGTPVWVKEYLGSSNIAYAKNLLDSAGNLIVLGISRAQGLLDSNNYALIKYTPEGDTSWVRLSKMGALDIRYNNFDFGIDERQNIYVFYPQPYTGVLWDNFCIAKYSSEGALLKKVVNNHYMSQYYYCELFRTDKTGVCYIIGEATVNSNFYNFTYITKVNGTVGINNLTTVYDKDFSLQQNYPNPFNSSTEIKFNLPKAGNVKIVVYDITGKELQTITNKFYTSGNQSVNFNADKLSSGVFFYKVSYENFSLIKKMVLIK